jgi:type VI secretion system protein ImpF
MRHDSAKGFAPTIFDKLFDNEPRVRTETNSLRRLNIEELKESVAADLETLLNSRRGHSDERLQVYAQAAESILSFGIVDFVGLSLSNPADCHRICRGIEQAIQRHEKRLRNVRVSLENDRYSTNTLRFCINALLVVYPAREPVNFDALLQPTTQQYSVLRGRRPSVA